MKTSPLFVWYFISAALVIGERVDGAEPSPRNSKPKLAPRALPGSRSLQFVDRSQGKSPFETVGNPVVAGTSNAVEKARIGVIHRGVGDLEKVPESANVTPLEVPALSGSATLPPLKSGQVRVIPRSETDSAKSIQPEP